ncbi:MAG: glycosyltransferase family 4 protein [Candidatus Sungbacteria bacterium]|nr:glycosyltransferase family 4 protein [Candidatus Sungbacteria bacterium]
MKKLRIAVMVSGAYPAPPPQHVIYAPIDVAVRISAGLSARGHAVDFYGPIGTKVKGARVISKNLLPLEGMRGEHKILKGDWVRTVERSKIFSLWDQYLIAHMYERAERGEHDLVHIHPVDSALAIARSHPRIPTIYTLHDPVFSWRAAVSQMLQSKNQLFVSISRAQKKAAPRLNWLATVYNGIPVHDFPFSEKVGEYLVFVGRMHAKKGPAEAIEAAQKTGEKLILIGPHENDEYWKEKIKPHIGGNIQYKGVVKPPELYEYYARAKALLFPVQWEEPFGLVMVEAMACGTPVIAFRRGSVMEIIEDGKTGFIVRSIDEMAQSIKMIETISRADCRRHVEKNFSVERMTDQYEAAFYKALGLAKKSLHKTGSD